MLGPVAAGAAVADHDRKLGVLGVRRDRRAGGGRAGGAGYKQQGKQGCRDQRQHGAVLQPGHEHVTSPMVNERIPKGRRVTRR